MSLVLSADRRQSSSRFARVLRGVFISGMGRISTLGRCNSPSLFNHLVPFVSRVLHRDLR